MFVIAGMPAQQAVSRPDFHRVGGDLQAVRDFVQGQQSASPESRVPRAQLMAVSNVLHDAAMERLPGPREIPAFVQNGRGFGVGVLIEELIDEAHDLGAGSTELPRVQRSGQRQRCGRAAAIPEMSGEPVRDLDEGDILEQQADHPFSLTIGCVGVVPEPREVGCEGENPLARVSVHSETIGVSLSIVRLLRLDDRLQGAIPLGF